MTLSAQTFGEYTSDAKMKFLTGLVDVDRISTGTLTKTIEEYRYFEYMWEFNKGPTEKDYNTQLLYSLYAGAVE